MSVLVTGATGCVGSHVARALVDAGERVRVLLLPGEDLAAVDALRGVADRVTAVRGDVRDAGSVEDALRGCSSLFHLAGLTGIAGVDGAAMHAVNVDGTRTVAEAALRAGVRMVHTSSSSAVGLPVAGPPADEDFEFGTAPVEHPYPVSKRAGEREVLARVARGLDAVVLNPGPVLAFGGDWRRNWSGLVVEVARGRFRVGLPGGVGVVGREQVVAAHLAARERGRTGRRYLVVEHNVGITELVAAVAREIGVREPVATLPAWAVRAAAAAAAPVVRARRRADRPVPFAPEVVPFLVRPLHYDNARARAELGLRPQPLERSVAELVDRCRATGLIPPRAAARPRPGAGRTPAPVTSTPEETR